MSKHVELYAALTLNSVNHLNLVPMGVSVGDWNPELPWKRYLKFIMKTLISRFFDILIHVYNCLILS